MLLEKYKFLQVNRSDSFNLNCNVGHTSLKAKASSVGISIMVITNI